MLTSYTKIYMLAKMPYLLLRYTTYIPTITIFSTNVNQDKHILQTNIKLTLLHAKITIIISLINY